MTDAGEGRFELLLKSLRRLEDAALVALLGVLVLLASVQIALRNFFDAGIVWGDPLLRVLVLWVGLLGAMAASRDDRHISVDVLSGLLSPLPQSLARACTNLFAAVVAALIAYHSARFVVLDYQAQVSAFARFPAWPFELILPLAFAVIALRALASSLLHARALFSAQSSS